MENAAKTPDAPCVQGEIPMTGELVRNSAQLGQSRGKSAASAQQVLSKRCRRIWRLAAFCLQKPLFLQISAVERDIGT